MGVGKRGGGGGGGGGAGDKGCHTGAEIPLMQPPTIKMEGKKEEKKETILPEIPLVLLN